MQNESNQNELDQETADFIKQAQAFAAKQKEETDKAKLLLPIHVAPTNPTDVQKEERNELIRSISADRNAKLIEATETDWCSTSAELSTVIAKYLRFVQDQERRAVRLYELNKRFGIKARKFNTTTKQIMHYVTKTGEIDYTIHNGTVMYLDPVALETELSICKTAGERVELRLKYLERAIKATRRK